MRGEFGDESDATIDMGRMQYRRHGQQGIAEVSPDECPAGHPLTPPNVAVGWDGTGRTFTCWTCYHAGTRPHTMRYAS